MYHLIVLETKGPKIKVQTELVPSEASEKKSCSRPMFLACTWLSLPVSLHNDFCGCLCVQISPLYRDTSHTGFGAHPTDLIVT